MLLFPFLNYLFRISSQGKINGSQCMSLLMDLDTYCQVAVFVFYAVPYAVLGKMFNRLSSKKLGEP